MTSPDLSAEGAGLVIGPARGTLMSTGLHFRSENAFAKGCPRRPRQTRRIAGPPATDLGSDFALVPSPGSIQPALSLPLEMHTLYYCADHFSPEKNMLTEPGQEFVSYVLPYWELAEPDSSLRLAMTAYSNAVFGRNKGVRSALCLAKKTYTKTVKQTLEEMKTLSASTIYQAVLAMMLMGSYENVMYSLREPSLPPPSDEVGSRFWENICHEKGAATLLSVRRDKCLVANIALDRVIRQKCVSEPCCQGPRIQMCELC